MNATDRQRLKLWGILLVFLALGLWVGQQIYDVPSVSEDAFAGAPAPESVPDLEVPGRWKDLEEGAAFPDDARRNPFEYGPEPAPEVRSQPALPPVVSAPPRVEAATGPPPPPPPPPIPFRYSGYSTVGGDGRLRAWLFEGDDARFGVQVDDVIMGRYQVNAITPEFVEIEDLEYSRRQRLPLIMESP